jgi:hypothetical protein
VINVVLRSNIEWKVYSGGDLPAVGSDGGFFLRRVRMKTMGMAIAKGVAKTAIISAMTIKSGPSRFKKLASGMDDHLTRIR